MANRTPKVSKKVVEEGRKRRRLEQYRSEEIQVDYINSLRQRIRDLEDELSRKNDLISCLERKERRLRIFAVSCQCPDKECRKEHQVYAAFVNRRVYTGSDCAKLVSRLRGLGYFVKETTFSERPPVEGRPFDGECDFLKGDLRDIKLPDGVGPEILEELDEGKTGV